MKSINALFINNFLNGMVIIVIAYADVTKGALCQEKYLFYAYPILIFA